ncbi:MAG TPA: recombinase family protein [Candidatus Saccharimonadia bacterium]|nr:recombinase family protein [Candidatus Saccharimonadia bacterium]
MASHRAFTAGATTTSAAQSPGVRASARDTTQASGGRALTRAALYARVSTEKQEREETVASQVDLLQQTAKARGYEVLPGNLFIDDGVSGTRLDRPALERLRDLAAEGTFEVVLVTAPDRLARRYAYHVVLVEELTRSGGEVVFVHQSLGASPEEQMLLQMQGVFAEYERAVAYLGAADNVSRPLPSPLSDVNQLVICSRNSFSRSHPARLAYL